jgi:hypothetical protein
LKHFSTLAVLFVKLINDPMFSGPPNSHIISVN